MDDVGGAEGTRGTRTFILQNNYRILIAICGE